MFKYTLKNIMRTPFRYLAMFLILAILFTGVMVAYSISFSATKNMEAIREDIGGRVNFEVDIETYIKDYIEYAQGNTTTAPEMKKLEWSQINRIKKSEYLKDYNVNIEGAGTSAIKPYAIETTTETSEGNPDFRLIGDRLLEYNTDFWYDEKRLVDGRGYTADEAESMTQVAVIDKRLAELNDLMIGDTFEFSSMEGMDMNLEVIGIYEDTKEDPDNATMSYMLRANCIYVPYLLAMESRGNASYKELMNEAAFFVKDPLKINDFRNSLYRTTVQLKGYVLNADDAVYEKKVLPFVYTKSLIEQPGRIALYGGIVLALILTLVVAYQKRTVASGLQTMGLDSKRIHEFLVSDLTAIVLLSFLLSLVAALFLVQPLANRTILSTRPAVAKVVAISEQDAAKNALPGSSLSKSMKIEPVFTIVAHLKASVLAFTAFLAMAILAFYNALCKREHKAGNPLAADDR